MIRLVLSALVLIPSVSMAVEQCGTICGAGFHSDRTFYRPFCPADPPHSTAPNGADCLPNTMSFEQCGISCPDGYRLVRAYYNGGQCPGSKPPTFNRAQCVKK